MATLNTPISRHIPGLQPFSNFQLEREERKYGSHEGQSTWWGQTTMEST